MSGSSSKMSVTQLTLLTALNMMGSGIIMLPTKLADMLLANRDHSLPTTPIAYHS